MLSEKILPLEREWYKQHIYNGPLKIDLELKFIQAVIKQVLTNCILCWIL